MPDLSILVDLTASFILMATHRIGFCTAHHPLDFAEFLQLIGVPVLPAVPDCEDVTPGQGNLKTFIRNPLKGIFQLLKYTKLQNVPHTPIQSYIEQSRCITAEKKSTSVDKVMESIPSSFQFLYSIQQKHSVMACYRGYIPRTAGEVISVFVAESLTKSIKVGNLNSQALVSDGQRRAYFIRTLIKDFIEKSVKILISQPFYVISSRSMAQFVNGEKMYDSIFDSITLIYKNEGITGFFTSLVPRWLGEMASFIFPRFFSSINEFFLQTDMKYNNIAIKYWCHRLAYPFHVVSARYAINNCGLPVGNPPDMPVFNSWVHAWKYLQETNQIYGGFETLDMHLVT